MPSASVYLEDKETGDLVLDRSVQIRVFDLDFNLLDSITANFTTGSNGLVYMNSESIPGPEVEVLLSIRDESMEHLDAKDRVVRVLSGEDLYL